jgi:hypothetical protein
MAVKDFFARERNLDWPTRYHRELAYGDFVIERVALSTEPAAVRRSDDADVACGKV